MGPTGSAESEYVPIKIRRAQTHQKIKAKMRALTEESRAERMQEADADSNMGAEEDEEESADASRVQMHKKSLLATSIKLRAEAQQEKRRTEGDQVFRQKKEEEELREQVNRSQNQPLISVKERAKGIIYSERMRTDWQLPEKYAAMSETEVHELREKWVIDVEGEDIPPPMANFVEMRFPDAILEGLAEKGIGAPTQIQMQGIPAVLQGRDLIGVAFTGSGKTLVFGLPMLMAALKEELRMRLAHGEGPCGLVLCPSRELANQTYQTMEFFARHLKRQAFPEMRNVCLIGGISVSEQSYVLRRGVHIAVATPGRLGHLLNDKLMHLRQCSILAIDEADKLVDESDEEVRDILSFFHKQRQTILFSATMPPKIRDFAKSALVQPVLVNVGRAGAANLDVVQEIEYVKQEAKLPYLLSCLEKTSPPVLVFCDNKKDVDDIYEYLLVKGVEVVAIHGGLGQEERSESIQKFREGTADVLVGTDVASKGLDFPSIQHVINFDMPKEIETYVHRIGRTGRCGRTGVATTFINKNQEETILLDLRALLVEAGQKVPPFLEALESSSVGGTPLALKEIGGIRGCSYCGGLGHRITECPKLDSQRNKKLGSSTSKDYLAVGSRYGGTQGYGGEW